MGVYEQMFDEEENLRMNCAAYERKGRLEGLAEGRRLQSEEVARRPASMAMSVENVSRATGMTPDEVRRLVDGARDGSMERQRRRRELFYEHSI
ncbi:MAG: hypothetical protein IKH98_08185 [Candidatus Methanomethylophilaceae archaeon]|nr:hypothetical protein [Candidatus Methanomethylophilaceae archaeon]